MTQLFEPSSAARTRRLPAQRGPTSPLVRAPAVLAPAPPHLRRRMRKALACVFAAEVVTLLAVGSLAWVLRGLVAPFVERSAPVLPGATPPDAGDQLALVMLVWVAAAVLAGAYSYKQFGVGYGEFTSLSRASVLTLGVIGFAAYVLRIDFSRGFLLITFVLGVPVLLLVRYLERAVLNALRARGRLCHRAILVGSPEAVSDMVEVLRREAWTGYDVLGVCVPEEAVGYDRHDVPVLGFIDDVAEVARGRAADTVIVAGGSYRSSHDLRRVGWQLEGLNVELLVAPSLTDVAGPRISIRNAAGLPLMHVQEPALSRARGPLKKFFDRGASLGILLLASPLLLLIALAVKLYDGGPVFFRQSRVGALGEEFPMVKFRSMVVGAESRRAELVADNECDGVLFKIQNDPRITPVGRLLRRFSLDELPQLFNVVAGQMSLVGPRPALPHEVEVYHHDVRRRLLVRPGMTGLWQVSGRSDLSWDDSVRLDLYYVDNWSMVGDLVIMGKTVRAVLAASGAY